MARNKRLPDLSHEKLNPEPWARPAFWESEPGRRR
jgi:hypothetical protein